MRRKNVKPCQNCDEHDAKFFTTMHDAIAEIGFTKAAKRIGVRRETLHKMLSPGGNPRFRTLWKIWKLMESECDLKVTVEVQDHDCPRARAGI